MGVGEVIRKHFFLFLHKSIHCGYSSEHRTLEVPQQGVSNEYPNYIFCCKRRKFMFLLQNKKMYVFVAK